MTKEELEKENKKLNKDLENALNMYAEAKGVIKNLINIIAENIDVIDTEQKGLNYKQAVDFIKG